ncbi:MAG: hypothetical protein ACXAEU_04340 [Candidatus Hodarchaeales archaeon]|jgi:predicted DNA-binding protein YlxM (UPF0122 family)
MKLKSKINVEDYDKTTLKDPERLRSLYWDEGLSHTEIAERIGCSRQSVWNSFKKYRIESRTIKDAIILSNKKRKSSCDPERLRQLYWVEMKSTREIAKIIDVSTTKVLSLLKEHGIQTRSNRLTENLSYDQLFDLYWVHKKSLRKTAKELGINEWSVRYWLKKFAIPTRDKSQAQANRFSKDIPITPILSDLLTGSLLGDGHLKPCKYQSSYCFSSKYSEYRDYIHSLLNSNGYKTKTGYRRFFDKRFRRYYEQYWGYTFSTKQLHQLRKKWYPKGEKKSFPRIS